MKHDDVLGITSLPAIVLVSLHLADDVVRGFEPGGYFFTWTLFALGATGSLSLVLSVRGLWNLRSGAHAARSP